MTVTQVSNAVLIAAWLIFGLGFWLAFRTLKPKPELASSGVFEAIPLAKPLPIEESSDVIVGWRCWSVGLHMSGPQHYRVVLMSFMGASWPAGEKMSADTIAQSNGPRPNGIHAYVSRETAEEHCRQTLAGASAMLIIYGSLSMWGRVIQHDQGYRSEFAYPRELFIPRELLPLFDRKMIASALRNGYGCEVTIET